MPSSKVLISVCFLFVAGCSSLEMRPDSNNADPTLLLENLSLNWLLATPLTVTSQNELREQLFQAWDAVVKVGADGEQAVRNCQEFFLAEKNELEPFGANEFVPYRLMGVSCKAISLSLGFKEPAETYLGTFALNKALVSKLPPELAFFVSASRRETILSDPRIQSWADVDKIVAVKRTNEYQAVFVDSDKHEREFFVLTRGDYNGDGVEDILLKSVNSVSGGSYVSAQLFVLTRHAHHDRYVLLDSFS